MKKTYFSMDYHEFMDLATEPRKTTGPQLWFMFRLLEGNDVPLYDWDPDAFGAFLRDEALFAADVEGAARESLLDCLAELDRKTASSLIQHLTNLDSLPHEFRGGEFLGHTRATMLARERRSKQISGNQIWHILHLLDEHGFPVRDAWNQVALEQFIDARVDLRYEDDRDDYADLIGYLDNNTFHNAGQLIARLTAIPNIPPDMTPAEFFAPDAPADEAPPGRVVGA